MFLFRQLVEEWRWCYYGDEWSYDWVHRLNNWNLLRRRNHKRIDFHSKFRCCLLLWLLSENRFQCDMMRSRQQLNFNWALIYVGTDFFIVFRVSSIHLSCNLRISFIIVMLFIREKLEIAKSGIEDFFSNWGATCIKWWVFSATSITSLKIFLEFLDVLLFLCLLIFNQIFAYILFV